MYRFKLGYLVSLLTFGAGLCSTLLWQQIQTSQTKTPVNGKSILDPIDQAQIIQRDEWEDYFGTPLIWAILLNDKEYGRLAVVRAPAIGIGGEVPAKLRLDCPAYSGSVQVLVGDMEKTGFNLTNYFVNGDARATRKNVVDVRISTSDSARSFKTKAQGYIGYGNLFSTVVFFELVPTKHLERTIARGGSEVTFVIHDLNDSKKSINVTFPAIDTSSQMATDLNACR